MGPPEGLQAWKDEHARTAHPKTFTQDDLDKASGKLSSYVAAASGFRAAFAQLAQAFALPSLDATAMGNLKTLCENQVKVVDGLLSDV